MPNVTRFQEPAPNRNYETVGVDEEILQTFASPGFVMPNAAGRYIPYDGTSDPGLLDIRFAVEPAHNYPRIQVGASKLEVLGKAMLREIEITMFKGGVLLTAADLTIGKNYGVTLVPSATACNGTGKAIWTIDPAKVLGTVACLKVTAIDLRGFFSTGRVVNMDTGTAGDFTARVLAVLYR